MIAWRPGIGGGLRAALCAVALALALPAALSPGTALADHEAAGSPTDSGLPPGDPDPAPSITGQARDGQVLTANEGDWSGTGALSVSHVWLRCNSAGSSCGFVHDSDDDPTITLGPSDVGHTFRIRATGTTLTGTNEEDSAQTAVVAANPPVAATNPSFTGTPAVGRTLVGSSGSFTGTPPITENQHQWQRCTGAGFNTCNNIPGETDLTYVVAPADIGARLRMRERAEGPQSLTTDAFSAKSEVVTDPPDNTAPPTIGSSGGYREGQTLTALPGTWESPVPTAFSYQWQRCTAGGGACADVPGARASSYALTGEDAGLALRVVVSATGPDGTGIALSALTPVIAALDPPGGGGGPAGRSRLLSPFPLVALRGGLLPRGANLSLLRVSGERGATVRVRCFGRGCPVRKARRRLRRGSLRLRAFERFLRGGLVIVIRVTKPSTIGKYTRMRIRGGVRRPKRVDLCLRPGARRPSRCPS